MNWDRFVRRFAPVENPLKAGYENGFYGHVFDEAETEKYVLRMANLNRVWTWQHTESGDVLSPGYWHNNRLGYVVATVPYHKSSPVAVESVDLRAVVEGGAQ